jgi:hypothetical protein
MIRVLAFIRRLPGVSRDDFRTHYEGIHVPIALPFLTGTSGYVRHHVREELYGRADFDCMTRFDYPDPEAARAVFARTEGPQAEAVRRDERSFMDKPAIVFFPVEQAGEVREAGDGSPEAVHLLVCVRRPPSEDANRFRARFLENDLPALSAAVRLQSWARPQFAFPGAAQSRGFDAVIEIAAAGAGEIPGWARSLEAQGAQVIAARVSVHETRLPG